MDISTLKYKVNDQLVARIRTDIEIELDIEITAVSNFDFAATIYDNLFLKLFNSHMGQELLQRYRDSAQLFYIARVLKPGHVFSRNEIIVLTDDIILHDSTYFLHGQFSLQLGVQFSFTDSTWKTPSEIINALHHYLNANGVWITAKRELSYIETLEEEANTLHTLLDSLRELRDMDDQIQRTFDGVEQVNLLLGHIDKDGN